MDIGQPKFCLLTFAAPLLKTNTLRSEEDIFVDQIFVFQERGHNSCERYNEGLSRGTSKTQKARTPIFLSLPQFLLEASVNITVMYYFILDLIFNIHHKANDFKK